MMKSIWKRVKPWSIPLGLTLLFYLVLQFVLLIGYVPSASMEPTLKEGSFIVGLRTHKEPQIGDIIVFEKDGILQVKRVAAGPSDVVDLEKLTYAEALPIPQRSNPILVVPDHCYFVLGDNTQNSLDSRYWEDPFVNDKQIVAIVPCK